MFLMKVLTATGADRQPIGPGIAIDRRARNKSADGSASRANWCRLIEE
jgi:hypothetical protein